MYSKLKRILDFSVAFILLMLLSPVFILIIIAIKVDSNGKIIFKQKRLGKNKIIFDIYKFRTMRIETPKEVPTHLLEDPNQWITKVGKVLRKTSLDELPQLFNIVKGDMSFVGPRPALWNQTDLIDLRDIYSINNIVPGLTGWAQVNGRDELPIPEKVRFDFDYSKQISFIFDLKCIFLTVLKVFKSEGVVEGRQSN